ncbi:MAG: AraC family transcriptional regulator [Kiritimatiellae bacterium]|nr:AraC family transcriptional regulator [Kiritimatiellia bacterium]
MAEIADRCAFPDESSLSRRFLALFGETPSRWRRLARSRRAAGIF